MQLVLSLLARRTLSAWVGLCVLLACILAGMSAAQAAEPAALHLHDAQGTLKAWPVLSMQTDATRTLGIQDVLNAPERWQEPPHRGGALGVRRDAVWLRIPMVVDFASQGQWALNIDHSDLNRIDVHLVRDGALLRHVVLGSAIAFDERPLRTRSHTVIFELVPGERYDLILRVETQAAMILPITLHTPSALFAHAVDEQMLQGVLTGLALCLIFYSLAQWASTREVLFGQYALLTAGSLLFSLHFFGIGRQYLWTNSLWFTEHAAGLSALMATTGSFLFISQTLAGHLPRSRFLRWMRGGAVLCCTLALLYALEILSTRVIAGVVSILGLVPALMGIPGALRRTRAGDAIGSTLLTAWVVYFVATAVVIGVINGWMPVNFWTMHSFQFGATLDMLLFLRVLGLRTQAVHKAALVASRERDAMHSLAHTDPLTGLPNRRGLQMALSSALSRSTHERMVAVYVMDLDGFKPVNDRHGHDVGDELLVAVTRRLQGHVRQSDLIARMGGDEFVIMATNLQGEQQAQDLGYKLLDAFHAPFALGSIQVQVGLTIGYAIAPLDSTDPGGLLKLADAAMYSGKQSGKFCLRRNTGDLALSSN
ncbi:MAG: diguanylate cyclase domain-containing protein [Burkholderiaceae bacterium]